MKKTWEQVEAEAKRYSATLSKALGERLTEMDRVAAENPHRAHELADARLELLAKAVRDTFLDGAAAAGGLRPRAQAYYRLGYSAMRDLRFVADEAGAGLVELAAIDRLERGTATLADCARLEPLARRADLPWSELFPDLKPGGDS